MRRRRGQLRRQRSTRRCSISTRQRMIRAAHVTPIGAQVGAGGLAGGGGHGAPRRGGGGAPPRDYPRQGLRHQRAVYDTPIRAAGPFAPVVAGRRSCWRRTCPSGRRLLREADATGANPIAAEKKTAAVIPDPCMVYERARAMQGSPRCKARVHREVGEAATKRRGHAFCMPRSGFPPPVLIGQFPVNNGDKRAS